MTLKEENRAQGAFYMPTPVGHRRFGPTVCFAPADEGAGSDGGDQCGDEGSDVNPNDPAVQALIRKAVDGEVTGLKRKNTELLGQIREFKDMIEPLGGKDGLAKFQEMQERLSKDELGQLFADPDKRDEYNQRILKPVKEEYEREKTTLSQQLEEARSQAQEAVTRLHSREIDVALTSAATEVGVDSAYMKAVKGLLADQLMYQDGRILVIDTEAGVDEDGEYRAKYGKDGRLMTVEEAVDDLRKTMPNLFAKDTGAGARGGKKGANHDLSQISDPVARLTEARKRGIA